MDLKGMGWRAVDWVDMAQDMDEVWAVSKMLIKFRCP
jgi:hypothetical protein